MPQSSRSVSSKLAVVERESVIEPDAITAACGRQAGASRQEQQPGNQGGIPPFVAAP
ncbi:hypothetical protein H6F86_25015 [Phormidium sp. FACHB-592]|uniref:Uncharacterized protein n=1 Tax=Stenomitos frigidus AS-A4 TaxID=2933935 RepID=A0ABV0KQC2_9CYAN|nr:hypothetical protein [Phormidium sp. FACHB-592]MBD2077086.1 hypothetical protein [Phormidium sp. FACHB-592]